eukprot:163439-Prymnesium_polylepis.1
MQVVEDHVTACRIADASTSTELVFVVLAGVIPSTPRVASALLPEGDTHVVHVDKKQGPIGITVSDRTPKPHRRPIGAGVLVTGLTPTGLAMAAGLQIGDCIVAVNGVQARRIFPFGYATSVRKVHIAHVDLLAHSASWTCSQ